MTKTSSLTDKKILIIEDELLLLEMYQVAFETAGLEVVLAANGQEGWQHLQEPNIALVLLDIKMDDISGIEILKRLQQRPELKKMPIWALTNVGEESVAREAIALGAEEYIMKTKITPSELVAKVKERLKTGRPLAKSVISDMKHEI